MTQDTQKTPDTEYQTSYAECMAIRWSQGNPDVKQAKTLTEQDLNRVLEFIETKLHAARNRAMLLITYYSGMRVGEVASLRYVDVVDLKDKSIRRELILSPEQTKGGESRTVFINEKLRKELALYVSQTRFRDPYDKFFYTQKKYGKGFNANTLSQHFHYIYKNAGVVGASSHSGRRSFITNLASLGISVRVLASLAGHRHISTTQRYIEVNDVMKRNAVELI